MVTNGSGSSSSSSEGGNGGIRVQITTDPRSSAKPVMTQARGDMATAEYLIFRFQKRPVASIPEG